MGKERNAYVELLTSKMKEVYETYLKNLFNLSKGILAPPNEANTTVKEEPQYSPF